MEMVDCESFKPHPLDLKRDVVGGNWGHDVGLIQSVFFHGEDF